MLLRTRTRKQGASLLVQTSPVSQGRHWRALLSAAAITLLTIYGSQLLFDPARFPVRVIAFQGQFDYLDEADLQQHTAKFLEQSFFSIDLQALRTTLLERPWVKDVAVQRFWPDTIVVAVTERRVFAHWGEHQLLDVDGQRFQPKLIPKNKTWPYLVGPDGQEQNLMLTYQEAQAMLDQISLSIRVLRQDARWSWSLALSNGIRLDLGRRDIGQRLQRFSAVFSDILQPRSNEIAAVDLRYRNGFAVRWVEGISDAKTMADSGLRVRPNEAIIEGVMN